MQSPDLQQARDKVAEEIKVVLFPSTQLEDNEKARKELSYSFVSDTITAPTTGMYEYAVKCSLGDDVYFDPCTDALEKHMAKITGKEAALYLPSGTMSNQVAIRSHLNRPPYSVLCDHRAHIYKYEAGGIAFHSGASVQAVIPSNGHHLTLEDVRDAAVFDRDVHFAPTELIALENTLNGTIMPQDEVIAIANYAHSNGIKIHLDGARIWHVAAETGTPLSELCAPFDSVSMCFSKGLGAPIGSCLVGSASFIKIARGIRKLYGGAMRQTGFLIACAAYALNENFPRLTEVHALARKLQSGLEDIGVTIASRAETNMVFFDPSTVGLTYDEIIESASRLDNPIKLYGSRLVIHIQTSEQAVDDLLSLISSLAKARREAGWVPLVNGESKKLKDVYVRKHTIQ